MHTLNIFFHLSLRDWLQGIRVVFTVIVTDSHRLSFVSYDLAIDLQNRNVIDKIA